METVATDHVSAPLSALSIIFRPIRQEQICSVIAVPLVKFIWAFARPG